MTDINIWETVLLSPALYM